MHDGVEVESIAIGSWERREQQVIRLLKRDASCPALEKTRSSNRRRFPKPTPPPLFFKEELEGPMLTDFQTLFFDPVAGRFFEMKLDRKIPVCVNHFVAGAGFYCGHYVGAHRYQVRELMSEADRAQCVNLEQWQREFQ